MANGLQNGLKCSLRDLDFQKTKTNKPPQKTLKLHNFMLTIDLDTMFFFPKNVS